LRVPDGFPLIPRNAQSHFGTTFWDDGFLYARKAHEVDDPFEDYGSSLQLAIIIVSNGTHTL
jgi:hypothetical protein